MSAKGQGANEWEEKERLDLDGLRMVEDAAGALRFGRDKRVREACRLLRLSRPLFLKVRGGEEGGEGWWLSG